jgi:hypothetical protein
MDAFNLSSPYPHHYEEIDERLSSLDISGRGKSSIFNENVSKNIQPTKQRLSSHLNKHQLDINQCKFFNDQLGEQFK